MRDRDRARAFWPCSDAVAGCRNSKRPRGSLHAWQWRLMIKGSRQRPEQVEGGGHGRIRSKSRSKRLVLNASGSRVRTSERMRRSLAASIASMSDGCRFECHSSTSPHVSASVRFSSLSLLLLCRQCAATLLVQVVRARPSAYRRRIDPSVWIRTRHRARAIRCRRVYIAAPAPVYTWLTDHDVEFAGCCCLLSRSSLRIELCAVYGRQWQAPVDGPRSSALPSRLEAKRRGRADRYRYLAKDARADCSPLHSARADLDPRALPSTTGAGAGIMHAP